MNDSTAKTHDGMLWRPDGSVISWDRAPGEDYTTFVQTVMLPDGSLRVVRSLAVIRGGKR